MYKWRSLHGDGGAVVGVRWCGGGYRAGTSPAPTIHGLPNAPIKESNMDTPDHQENRDFWNAVVPLHTSSDFYNLEAFKAGATSLLPIELEELGNVDGKTLLHLQCHFG